MIHFGISVYSCYMETLNAIIKSEIMNEPVMLPAKLKDIAVAVDGKSFIILLETVLPEAVLPETENKDDTGSTEIVPISIGQNEALSIALARNGEHLERPQTHDLMISMLEMMDGKLKHIEVCDLKDHVFYGKVVIEHRGIELDIDARPSDALALAIREKTNIFIAKHVVDELAMSEMTDEDDLFDGLDAAEA